MLKTVWPREPIGDRELGNRGRQRLFKGGIRYTDRFALASVMFEIETGTKPAFAVLDNSIRFPALNTGSESLDLIIERAWFEKYESTLDMLGDIKALLGPNKCAVGSILHTDVIESLEAEIREWRLTRAQKYGELPF